MKLVAVSSFCPFTLISVLTPLVIIVIGLVLSTLISVSIAGVNTASLGGCLHSSKKRARWAEGFHSQLNGHVFDLERDGLRQVVHCP